ncbi:uncharacterized protein L969DRAFT_96363 [Mixia osmundae IAM 14324]|uniref:PIG-P domain-containing protein n=1 Tax=Mixia osmundae (strain CBS 9802 / IAM 14324 / JCM 22182 / KY 12970) TaxID=764103 RepID=G7DWF1_MIXOS|nr:uncharacterized protein L969DRAFT_96363 [Mixia osmundae IAM 14324]KEI37276.1 hypothetical protein L969DRAFT_96363 [Mixia osmundae IAM 14324]GAA94911.1 hypothetical protein E5Q_01566 [Mixia osmundae IAM 14324]
MEDRQVDDWRQAHEDLHGLLQPPHYGLPVRASSPASLASLWRTMSSRPSSPSNVDTGILRPFARADLHTLRSKNNSRSGSTLPMDIGGDDVSAAASAGWQEAAQASHSPVGPSKEIYGFVVYVGSWLVLAIFLLWAFTEDETLVKWGVDWYPSREWALLVPAWILMTSLYTYAIYMSLNVYRTAPLESLEVITDSYAYMLPQGQDSLSRRQLRSREAPGHREKPEHAVIANSYKLPSEAIPILHDLPVTLINATLFDD